ncbi:MAG: polysaccharide biosynthesis protein [Balneolaceae bacterium]|nr:MAG: polysaccharide biosynthesis protein [Balneolaceae bacterium]
MVKKLNTYRDLLKFLLEISVWSLITVFAFFLRFDGFPEEYREALLYTFSILFVIKIMTVYAFATHRQSWRNTGFTDLVTLLKSVSFVSFLFFAGVILTRETLRIPISIPVIEFILSLLILSGIRVVTRYTKVYRSSVFKPEVEISRVLIAGAGESGNMAAREMFRHPEAGMKPVAFLDDDKSKHGQKFLGLPVLGSMEKMGHVIQSYQIDEVLIAMPSESGQVIRRIVDLAIKTGVTYRIIPSIYDLIRGKVTINQIRNVDVEDLLRRKPVTLNTALIRNYLKGKIIMVTGAGGSIGSEIVKQLCKYNPKHLILIGRGENSIYTLGQELDHYYPEVDYSLQIADIRDYSTMEKIFAQKKPDVLFHAAAHKHVPLMEENPDQAVFNNVEGTRNLVNLSLEYGVSYFVNISTDKAVNPTSIMGATKRVSEQIVQWGASQTRNGEVFVSVRFGNVLGSRGSVIPKFKNQIRYGGPVTITHPEMIRYFMTIPEASQLVLQAGALDMNGSVFVLDMGEPVSIEKMARDLIKLSGLEPDKDIAIEYSGIRPGEKLYEELLTAEEGTDVTQHEKIYVARSIDNLKNLSEKLDHLHNTAKKGDKEQIKSAIHELVPSFRYHSKLKAEI